MIKVEGKIRVFIQQPVIPKYRVPLFKALAKSKEFKLEIHASKAISGMPRSADEDLYEFNFTEHECKLKFGGSFYYQEELNIPSNFGEGDILVYNSNPRFLSNNKLVSEAKKRKMRVIAWNHANSSTSSGLKSWLRKKLTATKADDLLLYTEDELAVMQTQGWNKENLYYLNNTIDEKEILRCIISYSGANNIESAKASDKIVAFRKEYDINQKKAFLFCGRLTEKSELNLLISAFKNIPIKDQSYFLFIIIGDGELKEEYKQQAEDAGVEKSFLWLGAIYEEGQLAPWFLSADFFIYPGAVGLSVNHAMSYGLPIITHDNRQKQMPEFSYIKDAYSGFLYKYQNIESLKDLLMNISIEGQGIRDNVVHSAYQEFSFEKMVSRFISCLLKEDFK